MIDNLEIKGFPTTRYQGSKRKIIDWIYENIVDLEFESALDGFGGTGSVSYLFKAMGKKVTYNDKYRFNYITGKALIENDSVRLDERDLVYLFSNHDTIEYKTIIQDNFKDIYYLDSENKWLDMVVSNIIGYDLHDAHINQYKRALAFYCLFQACLMKRPFNLFHRKNLYLRTNDVDRNFGNKTTWDTPFEELFRRIYSETNDLIFSNEKNNALINESIFDLEPNGYDLVYLDPPYILSSGRNETSDYLRCYHFLEGLVRYNEWEEYIDRETKNLRFNNTLESNDFKKSNAKKNMLSLIEKFKDSKLIISYKIGGHPSIDFIENAMNEYKSEVRIISKHYQYALNRQNGDARKNREVLIIGV